MKRKALGKGLSALLPDPDGRRPPPATGGRGARRPPRAQPLPAAHARSTPRAWRSWPPPSARAGWCSPSSCGGAGERYQIIAGERRWRAAQQLGLATVPVTVRDVPDDRLLELALVENIQREELTPLEEAQAFQRLQEELRLTQEEVARKVGTRPLHGGQHPAPAAAARARCASCSPRARSTRGHGRALLALERAEDQVGAGPRGGAPGLSVREVERRVALLRAPRGGAREAARSPTRARRRSGCAPPWARACEISAPRRAAGTIRIALRQRGGAATGSSRRWCARRAAAAEREPRRATC